MSIVKRWQVSIPNTGNPTRVVDGKDRAEARKNYLDQLGICHTPVEPDIKELTFDDELNSFIASEAERDRRNATESQAERELFCHWQTLINAIHEPLDRMYKATPVPAAEEAFAAFDRRDWLPDLMEAGKAIADHPELSTIVANVADGQSLPIDRLMLRLLLSIADGMTEDDTLKRLNLLHKSGQLAKFCWGHPKNSLITKLGNEASLDLHSRFPNRHPRPIGVEIPRSAPSDPPSERLGKLASEILAVLFMTYHGDAKNEGELNQAKRKTREYYERAHDLANSLGNFDLPNEPATSQFKDMAEVRNSLRQLAAALDREADRLNPTKLASPPSLASQTITVARQAVETVLSAQSSDMIRLRVLEAEKKFGPGFLDALRLADLSEENSFRTGLLLALQEYADNPTEPRRKETLQILAGELRHIANVLAELPSTEPTPLVVQTERRGRPDEHPPPTLPASRQKASVAPGDAQAKLISALCKHHKYSGGGCENLDPIGVNALARLAGCQKSTASKFFTDRFKSLGAYQRLCAQPDLLVAALKLLQGEVNGFIRQLADGIDIPDPSTM